MAYRGNEPTILIFGDSEAGIAAASRSAVAQGGRVAATLPIAQAVERLDSQVLVDLVILDVSVDHGSLLDQLFRRIEDGATSNRFASVVTIVPELVDITAARIEHDDVNVVVGRDPHALFRAVANGLARVQPQLREGDDSTAGSLRRPADDGEDAAVLPDVAGGPTVEVVDFSDVPDSVTAWADGASTLDPAVIRGIIRARRLRNQFFGAGLFADPAWDILLDLMGARIEGRSVAVSSLCIAAAVPATTALRWIKQLTELGLLRRVADPLDGRRVFIELTEDAVDTLQSYFAALVRGRQT